jgi:hypothetical protein
MADGWKSFNRKMVEDKMNAIAAGYASRCRLEMLQEDIDGLRQQLNTARGELRKCQRELVSLRKAIGVDDKLTSEEWARELFEPLYFREKR